VICFGDISVGTLLQDLTFGNLEITRENWCTQSHKRKLMMDAELKCLRAVGSLEERILNACHAPNASYESVVKVWLLHPYHVLLGLITQFSSKTNVFFIDFF
jgi:hypothetical protein